MTGLHSGHNVIRGNGQNLALGARDLTVAEFVGACKGMRPPRVRNYLEAAAVAPDARLCDLSRAQRAALAGALRLRGGVEKG